MITLQNIILILQHCIKEFKDFIIFFIMYITHIAFVLNYYKLISLSHTVVKHMNNLTIMIKILKQNATQLINYFLIIVYFKKLIKHLNVKDTINNMKMKLLNNCFNK